MLKKQGPKLVDDVRVRHLYQHVNTEPRLVLVFRNVGAEPCFQFPRHPVLRRKCSVFQLISASIPDEGQFQGQSRLFLFKMLSARNLPMLPYPTMPILLITLFLMPYLRNLE